MSTSEPEGAGLPEGGHSDLDDRLARLYGARMPRSLDARVATALAAGKESSRRELRSRHTWRLVRLGAVVVTLAAVLVGGAYSAGNILNLGKPVNIQSTNQHFPLSGFHYIKTDLRSHGKAELLFIGALAHEGRVSAERWPLVKALEQFGTFSKVRPLGGSDCLPVEGGGQYCPVPSYDLSRAKYASKYLVFRDRDLIRFDAAKKMMVRYQVMNKVDESIFNKYARFQSGKPGGFVTMVEATMDNSQSTHTLPLILIGHYIQTISQVVSAGDFQDVRTSRRHPVRSSTRRTRSPSTRHGGRSSWKRTRTRPPVWWRTPTPRRTSLPLSSAAQTAPAPCPYAAGVRSKPSSAIPANSVAVSPVPVACLLVRWPYHDHGQLPHL